MTTTTAEPRPSAPQRVKTPWLDLGYLSAFVLTALIVIGTIKGGFYPLVGFFVGFVIVPIVDALTGIHKANLDPRDEPIIEARVIYRAILWAWTPFQLFLIALGAWRFMQPDLPDAVRFAVVISTGLGSGAIGINIGHELGHRRNTMDQFCAHVLFGSVSYLHFLVEHNRGHHIHIATPRDPATARLGESFWFFLPRTLIGQFLSAWRIEIERMKRSGKNAFHLSNVMIWYTLTPFVVALGFALVFGPMGALFFFGQSAMAVLLLESVNYIEHYGLTRREIAPGVYEKVEPRHSWNASYLMSNWLLFGLQRHADHHAFANRRYQILRHLEGGPQLPVGYPTMILLAWVPPLFFWVMNDRVLQARASVEPDAAH
jgi:alkane 1-monooxygenase